MSSNAGCLGDEAVCVSFNEPVLFPNGPVCAAGCQVDDDCNDAALGCSRDARFARDGVVLGICVPALNAQDAPCGLLDGVVALCTGTLRCSRDAADSVGACVVP